MKRPQLHPPSAGRPFPARRNCEGGFTVGEMLVAVGASMVILLGLVLGSMSLQRSYAATDQYGTAQNSELRVMDYLTRDLRRAMTVSVTPDKTQVSVTVPDYYDKYDANGNPILSSDPAVGSNPLDPVITTGAPVFGTNPLTITYFVDPTTNALIRQVNWKVGATAQQSAVTIADSVQNFQLAFVNYGSVIQAQITFLPIFEKNSVATARAGTTLDVAVTLREAKL